MLPLGSPLGLTVVLFVTSCLLELVLHRLWAWGWGPYNFCQHFICCFCTRLGCCACGLRLQAQHEETERAAAEVAQAQAELAAVRKRQLEQATAGMGWGAVGGSYAWFSMYSYCKLYRFHRF